MKQINHYVAWNEYHGNKYARYQGFAESESEFCQMCKNAGYDISDVDEIECCHANVRNEIGIPLKKGVSEY